MHAHLRAGNHQGISHIIPGVPHISQFYPFQMPEMLPYRQKIRQHLGRVEFIGQSVPYRYASIFCQFLHNLLPVAPVLDPVIHPPEYPRRVRNALFFPDLGTRRIKIGCPHAQIMRRHLKGTPCPCGRFLKDQGDIPAAEILRQFPSFLLLLK